MYIRTAIQADIDSVVKIRGKNSEFLGFIPRISYEQNLTSVRVAIIGDEIVGFVYAPFVKKYGMRRVSQIAVKQGCQRQGIGQALLESIDKPYRLTVASSNKGAIAFYRSMGLMMLGEKQGKRETLYIFIAL